MAPAKSSPPPAATEVEHLPTTTVEVEQLDVDEDPYEDANDDYESDLTSLCSTIKNHVYENGRRYHALKPGTYVLPNDEIEQERLDATHHMTSLILGGRLYSSPIEDTQRLHRVLDLGTGTGTWALAMAEEYPHAHVVGVDLSPIQPGWVFPNCVFEIDDFEEEWIYQHKFDFIHARNLGQGVKDWERLTKNMFDFLNPGGFAEIIELETRFYSDDSSIPENGWIKEYQQKYDEATAKAGIEDKGAKLQDRLQAAGFTDIRVVIKKMPIGSWPKNPAKKHLGKWGAASTALRGYAAALFTRELGMSLNDVEILCAGANDELMRKDVHAYFQYWFVSGRKPETD